jgi:hypothetical protein
MSPVRAKVKRSIMITLAALTVLPSAFFLACPSEGLLFLGIPFALIMAFVWWRHISQTPRITVSHDQINIGKDEWAWIQVKDLRGVRRGPLRSSSFDLRNLATVVSLAELVTGEDGPDFDNIPASKGTWYTEIEFTDGRVVRFRDDMYSNAWQIRDVIARKLQEPTADIRYIDPEETAKHVTGSFIYYQGFQLASIRGWLIWGTLLIGCSISLGVVTAFPGSVAAAIFALSGFVVTGGIFVAVSQTMPYVCLSEDCLVVTYHNVAWRREAFRLSDIEELSMEIDGGLVIQPKLWKTAVYTMPTIRRKQWDALRTELERKNVPVIDRRIYMYS